MGKFNKKVVSVASIAATLPALVGSYAGYQKLRYKRSAKAGLIELYLGNKYKKLRDIDETKRLEKQKADKNEETVNVYEFDTKSKFYTRIVSDRQVWHLNSVNNSNSTIFYIHGGSYVHEFVDIQWEMADKIAQESDAEVIIPDYGLAPFYTYKDSYELLTKLYTDYVAENPDKDIYVMGDSAGGGLALGLVQDFVQNNIKLPKGLILLSPWVDLTMSNPDIKKYIKKDPLLHVDTLLADAKSWADDADLSDWKVSPLYGEMKNLPEILLFSGTRELLYPDIALLAEKLREANVKTEFVIGKNLNHVYPAFPIPEATKAISKIVEFVKSK